MKNILFITHTHKMQDGATIPLIRIATTLPKDQFNVQVVVPKEWDLSKHFESNGIKTHVVPVSWWLDDFPPSALLRRTVKYSAGIERIIKAEKIDVVITNTAVITHGAFAAWKANVPHIWWVHEMLSQDPGIRIAMPLNYYYAMMSTFSYRMIAVSGAVRDELQTYIGNNDRIHVIHNSVDIPRYGSFPQWNDNIVLAAGGICPRKGYIHYIHAAAFVKKEFPKVEFRIAGSVWHRQYYKQLVQAVYDLGLQENVSFFGRTEDMATLYKSATICVIPSEAEPFSLVAIEAMARGLPVVATRSGGPQEIVRHEETGYLVPTGDPEEMAERIITLLTNRDLAKRMGDAGKERAKIKFNPEQQLAAFIEVLKEC